MDNETPSDISTLKIACNECPTFSVLGSLVDLKKKKESCPFFNWTLSALVIIEGQDLCCFSCFYCSFLSFSVLYLYGVYIQASSSPHFVHSSHNVASILNASPPLILYILKQAVVSLTVWYLSHSVMFSSNIVCVVFLWLFSYPAMKFFLFVYIVREH